MMTVMRPDEAEQFYEEDEDPARVFAVFDAAKNQGRTGRTAPHDQSKQPELTPLRDLAHDHLADLRRLRLRDRLALILRHMARTIQTRSSAG